MTSFRPRIAVPEPSSIELDYSERSWPVYAKAIEDAGGTPVRIKLGSPQSEMAQIASSCAAVLLPGNGADVNPEKYGQRAIPECGVSDPLRESADDLLLQDAFNMHKPILGICYGMQSMNVWLNGTLIQDLPKLVPTSPVNHAAGAKILDAHLIQIHPNTLLAGIVTGASDLQFAGDLPRLSVNSSHHQAVAELGDHLRVTAICPEDGVIEALEEIASDQFAVGVQWHPERTCETSPASLELFKALVAAAKAWKPRVIHESVAP